MFKDIYDDDVSLHSGIPTKFSHLQNKIFSDWEIPPWELYIDKNKLIGEGSWSYVYLAEWRKTTVVAKVLKDYMERKFGKLTKRKGWTGIEIIPVGGFEEDLIE